jgi:hypothetical protein
MEARLPAYPADDSPSGWATDFSVAIASLSFVASSTLVRRERHVDFFLGTFVAHGLGGAGHFLSSSASAGGLTAHYLVMTLAFGGTAYRSGVGWVLTPSRSVRAFQLCVGSTMVAMVCASVACGVHAYGVGATSYVQLSHSTSGVAYTLMCALMAACDVAGSVLWYVQRCPELPRFALVALVANVVAWPLVRLGDSLSVHPSLDGWTHRVAHYCQYLVIWTLHTAYLPREGSG